MVAEMVPVRVAQVVPKVLASVVVVALVTRIALMIVNGDVQDIIRSWRTVVDLLLSVFHNVDKIGVLPVPYYFSFYGNQWLLLFSFILAQREKITMTQVTLLAYRQ